MMQSNPQLAGNSFNDPRMISVLGVLMGIDMQAFAREEGSDELPPGLMKDNASAPAASSSSSKPSQPSQPAADVKMADPEPEEDDEEAVAKKAALAEKAKGNESYKKREFDASIESFKKAWELWPKDITFLTNLAGTYTSDSSRPSLTIRQPHSLRKPTTTAPLPHARRLSKRRDQSVTTYYSHLHILTPGSYERTIN